MSKLKIIKNSSFCSIWAFGSIKIEFGMSKNPCMQSMSFLTPKNVELRPFYVKSIEKVKSFSIFLISLIILGLRAPRPFRPWA